MLQALTAASCACVLIELASMQTVAAEKVPEALVGSWLAEDIGGRGVIDDLQTTLEIREDGTYGGMAGCNHFTGTFGLSGATITFGPAAATRKMCVPAVMDQERKFFEALKSELVWRIEGSKLFLGGRNEKSVLQLTSMQSRNGNRAELTIEIPDVGTVDRRTVLYACGDKTIEVEYIDAGSASLATFTIEGTFIVASNVISGSGARYAGGRYVWWTKDGEATLFDTMKGEEDPGIACKEVE